MKNQMLSVIHFRSRLQPSGRRTHRLSLYIICAAACVTLLPTTRAVNPPPDGGYPGGNTAEGDFALNDLTTGENNTAVGPSALYNNTTGSDNTAVGPDALLNNIAAGANTALGFQTLFRNTSGGENTATGSQALFSNTTGPFNTATGFEALFHNTTGMANTATGSQALFSNTIGSGNTANGDGALQSNTTGNDNTASGIEALLNNTIGSFNTAAGFEALLNNTIGSFNTANGDRALSANTMGSGNTAIGVLALTRNTTGSNNIALGNNAASNITKGSNNIDIGNAGVVGDSKVIRIGNQGVQSQIFIAGISGVTVAGGVGVVIDTNGHLGTKPSSARFKDEIKPIGTASEAILKLEPVTFRYKMELDAKGIPQFGLVAEQVDKINPDLVARDDEGKPYAVRYEAVNAMLLNEFLKEHRKVQEQQGTIAQLKENATIQAAALVQQQKTIAALTIQIQKVSEQVALSRPGPRVVSNNP
jgi:trimeric autotransporter adhesin